MFHIAKKCFSFLYFFRFYSSQVMNYSRMVNRYTSCCFGCRISFKLLTDITIYPFYRMIKRIISVHRLEKSLFNQFLYSYAIFNMLLFFFGSKGDIIILSVPFIRTSFSTKRAVSLIIFFFAESTSFHLFFLRIVPRINKIFLYPFFQFWLELNNFSAKYLNLVFKVLDVFKLSFWFVCCAHFSPP